MPDPTFGASAFNGTAGSAPVLSNLQKKLNNRYIPPELDAVKNLSDQTKVFIFNVGPWKQVQHMGSLGRFTIPACPEGKEYSEPLIIDGIVSELYPDSETSMKRVQSDGYETALQILGIGAHMSPTNSLTRYGCAVSRQWPPAKEEVKKAWKALEEGELSQLIREANAAAASGPNALEQTIGNSDRHFVAARLLKKTKAECSWLNYTAQSMTANVECKFCGEAIKPNLAKCPNCKEIVNQKLYAELTQK